MANLASENEGFTFLWTIENYNMHVLKPEHYYESPIFEIQMFNKSKWRFKLYPCDKNQAGYFRIEIEKVDKMAQNTCVTISFHLVTDKGDFFLDIIAFEKGNSYFLWFGKQKFSNDCDEDLSAYLKSFSLKLKCRLWNEKSSAFAPMACTALTRFHVEKHSLIWLLKGIHQCTPPCTLLEKIIFPTRKELPCIKIILRHAYNYNLNRDSAISYLTLEILNPDLEKCYRIKINIFASANVPLATTNIDWIVKSNYREEFSLKPINLLIYTNATFDLLTLNIDLAISSNEAKSHISQIGSFSHIFPKKKCGEVECVTVKKLALPKRDFDFPFSYNEVKSQINESSHFSNLHEEIPKQNCEKVKLVTDKNLAVPQSGIDLAISSNEVKSQINESSLYTNPYKEVPKQNYEKVKHVTDKNLPIPQGGIVSLTDDLGQLLMDKKFCDVKIITKRKEFFAHKNILAARCPVFSARFRSDMKEKEIEKVNIDDIDSETFEIFLNYLYKGITDDLTLENAISLYSAADKYEITALNSECFSFILNHLSEQNVCDILILSDIHQDEELKKAAHETFCIHSKTVLLSEQWVSLLEKKPKLGAEALREMAMKMK